MADTGAPWSMPLYSVNDAANGAAEVSASSVKAAENFTTLDTKITNRTVAGNADLITSGLTTVTGTRVVPLTLNATNTGWTLTSSPVSSLVCPATAQYKITASITASSGGAGECALDIRAGNVAGTPGTGTRLAVGYALRGGSGQVTLTAVSMYITINSGTKIDVELYGATSGIGLASGNAGFLMIERRT